MRFFLIGMEREPGWTKFFTRKAAEVSWSGKEIREMRDARVWDRV